MTDSAPLIAKREHPFDSNCSRTAAREFVAHYPRERHHQGLGNRLIIQEESELSASTNRRISLKFIEQRDAPGNAGT